MEWQPQPSAQHQGSAPATSLILLSLIHSRALVFCYILLVVINVTVHLGHIMSTTNQRTKRWEAVHRNIGLRSILIAD